MKDLLRRKIDRYLLDWKADENSLPLIVKGARQIGKTESVRAFAYANYRNVIEINFALQPQYRQIFENGYAVEDIVKNISLLNPSFSFIPKETLIFFDELQSCPACATSLKSFATDRQYDVICSGSLMGINYNEIESNSVGYKQDIEMHSMDFEEFLWARGYSDGMIEDMYQHMITIAPFSSLEMQVLLNHFHDYITIGGMPAIVNMFVKNGHFAGTLKMQRQLLLDYEEDITKYAQGLDKAKIKNVYNHISVFLAKENKKFQITKIGHGARSREYIGTVDWLADAGIINICYCLSTPELPLKGNYESNNYKLYFKDTGLLIASLDDEAQEDLRANRNFNTYKGAIYENIVADMLTKAGYRLYFYKNTQGTIEMDFFVRDAKSLIPVEVKARDGATPSLNNLIKKSQYSDIHYGIKLAERNIGYANGFYTFPYFLTFLLKRFLAENKRE